MHKTIGILLVSTMTLASCGSRLNPLNWFGRAEKVEVVSGAEINPLLPREKKGLFRQGGDAPYPGTLVADITELKIERVSDGAVIRVKGIAARQGGFEVVLEPENKQELPVDGVLTYRMLAIQPSGFRQGTSQSRELTAAVFKTNQDLQNVRTIRIVGANGALQVRRR